MIVYIKITTEPTKMLLQPISESDKIVGHKVNIQKSIIGLYIRTNK